MLVVGNDPISGLYCSNVRPSKRKRPWVVPTHRNPSVVCASEVTIPRKPSLAVQDEWCSWWIDWVGSIQSAGVPTKQIKRLMRRNWAPKPRNCLAVIVPPASDGYWIQDLDNLRRKAIQISLTDFILFVQVLFPRLHQHDNHRICDRYFSETTQLRIGNCTHVLTNDCSTVANVPWRGSPEVSCPPLQCSEGPYESIDEDAILRM